MPLDLWTSILEKTDISTCLACRNFLAAQSFLKSEQSKRKAVSQIIKTGNQEHLELLLGKLGVQGTVKHWQQAAAAGALQMMLLFERPGVLKKHTPSGLPANTFYEPAIISAAKSGHLCVVEHLRKNYNGDLDRAVAAAARNNHAEAVKFLLDKERPASKTFSCQIALQAASCNGHVQLAEYIFKAYPESRCHGAVFHAVSGGSVEMVQYYLDHYREAFEAGRYNANIALESAVHSCQIGRAHV